MMPDVLPEMSDGYYGGSTQSDTETPYQKLLKIVSDYPSGSGYSVIHNYEEERFAPALRRVEPVDLQQNNGEILLHAVKHKASRCVEALVKKTKTWHERTICDAIHNAASNHDSDSLRVLFRLDFSAKKDMLSKLNNQKSDYNTSVQNAIETSKANFIGSEWKKISQNEISHTISTNIAKIEHVFNFNAMSITTIAIHDKSVTMTERNFNDVQDDTDIVRAHETLSIFEQPPVYRGKNHSPRRSVNKRTPGNG